MPPEPSHALARINPVKRPADQIDQKDEHLRDSVDANSDPGQSEATASAGTGGGAGAQLRARAGKKQKRAGQEREFLPAALEILETPANPAGRAIALTIMAMFALTIVWAFVARIDVVALAPGRLVPVGGTKLVQPRELGSVRAIHVSDGQHVEAGELLVELDPTETEVNLGQVARERAEAALEAARMEAFIRAIRGQSFVFSPSVAGMDEAILAMHQSQLQSDIAAYRAKIAAMRADVSRLSAELAAVGAEVVKLTEMLPLLTEREANVLQLWKRGHSTKPQWQQAKAQLIEARHDVEIKKHRRAEATSAKSAAEDQLAVVVADSLRDAYAKLSEARKTFAQADLALRKALKQQELRKLRAPVAGTVQQLAVHTIGGVVQPAERLLVIVPDDAVLEVRAQLLNKDRGVLVAGQEAEIKFEAYDFTEYGTMAAQLISISNDAVVNDNLGLVYNARLALEGQSLRGETGENLPLTPGMAVTVEVKTGRRRVIDFLLSPLERYQEEAIRER